MKELRVDDAGLPISIGTRTEGDGPSSPETTDDDMCVLPTQTDSRDWMRDYLQRHRAWSQRTFGEGPRPVGIVKHIAKELDEILRDPNDLEEWIDVVILALDGATRQGYRADEIMDMLEYKQAKNQTRVYHQTSPDEPSEHVRNT